MTDLVPMTDLEKRVESAAEALSGAKGLPVVFEAYIAELALRAAFPELFTDPPTHELTPITGGNFSFPQTCQTYDEPLTHDGPSITE